MTKKRKAQAQSAKKRKAQAGAHKIPERKAHCFSYLRPGAAQSERKAQISCAPHPCKKGCKYNFLTVIIFQIYQNEEEFN